MTTSVVTLSVVVPAFNEEARLGATLADLQTFLGRQPWQWEIRVVDDGSADQTCAVAEQHGAGEPRPPHRVSVTPRSAS